MKLISMTDFVLEQLNEQNSRTKPMREVFNSLEKYAKFLKQPLKLEMFVPCEEEGEILNYNEILESVKEGTETWAIWETAKEKVLFEGFEVEGSICFNGAKRISVDYGIFIPTMRRITIEDLISDKKNPLQLTPTAIKQIQP